VKDSFRWVETRKATVPGPETAKPQTGIGGLQVNAGGKKKRAGWRERGPGGGVLEPKVEFERIFQNTHGKDRSSNGSRPEKKRGAK